MKTIKNLDKTLLVLTIIFSIFGCVMILSATSATTVLRYNIGLSHFFSRQLFAIALAVFVGAFVLYIPLRKYYYLSYASVVLIIVLLIYVLYAGKLTNNARSWIPIGPFNLQPSELAKSVQILFMAYFYNMLNKNKCKNIYLYFIPLITGAFMALLIYMQSDLGGAFILLALTGLVFLSVPYVWKNRLQILKITFLPIIFVLIVFAFNKDKILTKEKMDRLNFTAPCKRYNEESGYQVCNGFIAMANGGLFGVGLGKSSQKFLYLPESHTDFIFPIIVEELGAITGILVIIGYFIFIFKFLKIAKSSLSLRNSLIAIGVFWYFVLHIIINLGGVLALIPLTGVPLPLLSYGGSFTINVLLLMFLIQRVVVENKKIELKNALAKI